MACLYAKLVGWYGFLWVRVVDILSTKFVKLVPYFTRLRQNVSFFLLYVFLLDVIISLNSGPFSHSVMLYEEVAT